MKVKLLISRAGPAGSHNAGDMIEVSEAEAKRLIDANPPKAIPATRGSEGIEFAASGPEAQPPGRRGRSSGK